MVISGSVKMSGAEAGIGIAENRSVREKCRELEAVFIGYLLKTMRQSMLDSDQGESAKGIYEGLGDQALAKALSEEEALGIAKLLYQELAGRESNPVASRAGAGSLQRDSGRCFLLKERAFSVD